MPLWAKITLTVVGLFCVGLGLTIWIGSARWESRTARLVGWPLGPTGGGAAGTVSFDELGELSAPVAAYLRHVLAEGRPLVRSARIVQDAEFRAREADDGWRPCEATQHFAVRPPGFVWDARIRMAPLMGVRVRDAYVAGEGSMEAKVLSLVTVADQRGKDELNAGALQRYLAEAVWFPTALLPTQGVQWEPVDEASARATLTDSGTTVSLEFYFNDAHEVTGVSTSGRYREVDGEYEPTPWVGRFSDYGERDGLHIPLEAEVEWELPSGRFPYWRGRIVEVEYEFAR